MLNFLDFFANRRFYDKHGNVICAKRSSRESRIMNNFLLKTKTRQLQKIELLIFFN